MTQLQGNEVWAHISAKPFYRRRTSIIHWSLTPLSSLWRCRKSLSSLGPVYSYNTHFEKCAYGIMHSQCTGNPISVEFGSDAESDTSVLTSASSLSLNLPRN